jgi:hypothetical protein
MPISLALLQKLFIQFKKSSQISLTEHSLVCAIVIIISTSHTLNEEGSSLVLN